MPPHERTFDFTGSPGSPPTDLSVEVLEDGSLHMDVGGEYGGNLDRAAAVRLAEVIQTPICTCDRTHWGNPDTHLSGCPAFVPHPVDQARDAVRAALEPFDEKTRAAVIRWALRRLEGD